MTHRPRLATFVLGAVLAANPGCAGRQLTNRDVAVGVGAATFVGVLLFLAVSQCRKGPTYCDNQAAGMP